MLTLARWRRRHFGSVNCRPPLSNPETSHGWRPVPREETWIKHRLPYGARAIEIAGEIWTRGRVSSHTVIARLRYLDSKGGLIDAAVPGLRRSQKAGLHFYPMEFVRLQAFRVVARVPPNATQVEVSLQQRGKAEECACYERGLNVQLAALDLVAKGNGDPAFRDDRLWRAEKALRRAIHEFSEQLLDAGGPLGADEAPFGEAVVEHLIRNERASSMAFKLASKRLDAGREEEAAALLDLTSFPALKAAAVRQETAAWAKSFAGPTASQAPAPGSTVVLIEPLLGIDDLASYAADLKRAGWPSTVMERARANLPAKVAHPAASGQPPESELSPAERANRLLNKLSRQDSLGCIVAFEAEDCLVARVVADFFGVPTIYDMRDLATLEEVYTEASSINTDRGKALRTIYGAAISNANLVVVETEAAECWLRSKGLTPNRILVAPKPTAASAPREAKVQNDGSVVTVTALAPSAKLLASIWEGVQIAQATAPFQIVPMRGLNTDWHSGRDVPASLDVLIVSQGDVLSKGLAAPGAVQAAFAAGKFVITDEGGEVAELVRSMGQRSGLVIAGALPHAVAEAVLAYGGARQNEAPSGDRAAERAARLMSEIVLDA